MDDWHSPGENPPTPAEAGWIEPEPDPPAPPWPEAPGNRDRVSTMSILAVFGGAMLLCVLAGLIVMAGLSLRGQTWLGWGVIAAGLLLFLPAVALAGRALTLGLIALVQVGNRRPER